MTSKRIFGVVCISVLGSAIRMQLSELIFLTIHASSDDGGGERVHVERSSPSSSLSGKVTMAEIMSLADSNSTARNSQLTPNSVSIVAVSAEENMNQPENANNIVILMESPPSSVDDVSIAADVIHPAETRVVNKPVKQIILLGERHSGTDWITDYLTGCFDIKVNIIHHVVHVFKRQQIQVLSL